MNEKRKIIFKEALFTVPFLLIAALATLVVMFLSGRTPQDIERLVVSNFKSDSSADIAPFVKTDAKDYTVRYYYGDNTSSELYAEFSYEGKGDDPKSVLTLYESRDGFDPGVYSVMWFMSEQYVTYWPLNSSADGEGFEKYLANEVPLMFKFVNSYSWDGAMQTSGAEDGGAKGYACLGLKLFVWDHTEKEIMRNNFVWGVGGNPLEYYSYIPGSQGEYKKAVLKK